MTWLWPMRWSGPASPPSGCPMSPGWPHRIQGAFLVVPKGLTTAVLSVICLLLMRVILPCYSCPQTRGEGLQCSPAGPWNTHFWRAEPPCYSECPASQWRRPIWCFTLWQWKRRWGAICVHWSFILYFSPIYYIYWPLICHISGSKRRTGARVASANMFAAHVQRKLNGHL